MPKREIIHQAGHPLQPELRMSLLKYFKDSDLQRLERLGGRISISIAAPYIEGKTKSKKVTNIDQQLVKQIESLKSEPEKMREILNGLGTRELRQLSNLVGQPIRSNANAVEIRFELLRYFQAEDLWHRISQTSVE